LAVERPVVRLAVERPVVRRAAGRPVVRLAVERPVVRRAVEPALVRLAVERPAVRFAVERRAVERAVVRFAVERFAVERLGALPEARRPDALVREGVRRFRSLSLSRWIALPSLPPSRRASLTRFWRLLCTRRFAAPTSLPISLPSALSAASAESSALLKRLIAAGSLAAGRFRAVLLRRREAGFFAGGMAHSPESSLRTEATRGAYCLSPQDVATRIGRS
jgi:hypothetical protein